VQQTGNRDQGSGKNWGAVSRFFARCENTAALTVIFSYYKELRIKKKMPCALRGD